MTDHCTRCEVVVRKDDLDAIFGYAQQVADLTTCDADVITSAADLLKEIRWYAEKAMKLAAELNPDNDD